MNFKNIMQSRHKMMHTAGYKALKKTHRQNLSRLLETRMVATFDGDWWLLTGNRQENFLGWQKYSLLCQGSGYKGVVKSKKLLSYALKSHAFY